MKNLTFFIVMLFTVVLSAQNTDYASMVTTDKSETGEISYTGGPQQGIWLFKFVNGKEVFYSVRIKMPGKELITDANEVTLVFDNGKTIAKKKVKLKVEATATGYLYSGVFLIDAADIELLKNNVIVKKLVHTTVTDNITSAAGNTLKGIFNYMLTL